MIESAFSPGNCTPVRAGVDQPLVVLSWSHGGELSDAQIDASDRRAVPGDAVVRLVSDGATSAAQRLVRWSPPRPSADDQDGPDADLSAFQDQRAASAAQDPLLRPN